MGIIGKNVDTPLCDRRFEHTGSHGSLVVAERCDLRGEVTLEVPWDYSFEKALKDLVEAIGYHEKNIRPYLDRFDGYDCMTLKIVHKRAEVSPAEAEELNKIANRVINCVLRSSDASDPRRICFEIGAWPYPVRVGDWEHLRRSIRDHGAQIPTVLKVDYSAQDKDGWLEVCELEVGVEDFNNYCKKVENGLWNNGWGKGVNDRPHRFILKHV